MLRLAFIALAASSAALWAIHPADAQSYQQQQIGQFGYVQGPHGYNGSSQQVGSYNYYNDNRGNNCVTNRIGTMTYTNCY